MAEPNDRAEEEKNQDFKKSREYRQFRKLLKRVIKAPPMPKRKEA